MNKTAFWFVVTALFLTGCFSHEVRHIITGETRQPIAVESVKVHTKKPVDSVVIATILVKADGSDQKAFDDAMQSAKEECARLGANGFTMTGWKYVPNRVTYIHGVAYWLPHHE